jgi:hypothetical protein
MRFKLVLLVFQILIDVSVILPASVAEYWEMSRENL